MEWIASDATPVPKLLEWLDHIKIIKTNPDLVLDYTIFVDKVQIPQTRFAGMPDQPYVRGKDFELRPDGGVIEIVFKYKTEEGQVEKQLYMFIY